MKIERTPTGKIELRLSDDPDRFDSLAEAVCQQLGGEWARRIDGLDQSYWDLLVEGQTITIHREHYLGVSVICDDEPAKRELLKRLGTSFKPSSRPG